MYIKDWPKGSKRKILSERKKINLTSNKIAILEKKKEEVYGFDVEETKTCLPWWCLLCRGELVAVDVTGFLSTGGVGWSVVDFVCSI